MKNYVIAFEYETGRGTVLLFLSSVNNRWSSATNLTFNNVDNAVKYAKKNKVIKNTPNLNEATVPFIVGPKGGRYSIITGKRLRGGWYV